MNPDDLRGILIRLEKSTAPDRILGIDLLATLCPEKYRRGVVKGGEDDGEIYLIKFKRRTKWRDAGWYGVEDREPTVSVDAAVALIWRRLPGWWQSSGLCSLTGHASIGPDYNGLDAERLRREWPEERFHEGFHADLKPGDGRHRQCLALLHCLIQAEMARVR